MEDQSPISASLIADYLLLCFHEHGEPLTNLKLQKLLYYAQGWYLALHGECLFDDRMEAWIHGPVTPTIYQRFKSYTYGSITENPQKPELSSKISQHLDEVIEVYGSYSAFELEHMTHETDPWKIARGNLAVDEPSNATILTSDMRTYFDRKKAENEEQENP